MAHDSRSDDELLRWMRGGEEGALVALYRRWQGPVYRFALQMSGSHAVAEDVTQETFLVLIRDSGSFQEGRGSLGAYLYGIARHLVLRALTSQKAVAVAEVSGMEERAAPVAASDPGEELLRSERARRLWAAVLSLPVRYREVVVLCDLHEMGYAEAAAALGCRVGTIRSRLHRARSLLMERLRATGLRAKAVVAAPDGCAI